MQLQWSGDQERGGGVKAPDLLVWKPSNDVCFGALDTWRARSISLFSKVDT